MPQTRFERELGGFQRREHHAIIDNFLGFLPEILVRVLLHFPHDQLLIERAAIDANAHRLSVIASDFADGGKLLVAALTRAHISRIDAVFIQRDSAVRIFREQNVTVVVKVPNDRHFASRRKQAFLDFGNGSGGFRHIHSDAHNFGAGFGKLKTLLRRSGHICRIRVGHGLDDNGRAAAHADMADIHAVCLAPRVPRSSGVRTCDLGKHRHSILACFRRARKYPCDQHGSLKNE